MDLSSQLQISAVCSTHSIKAGWAPEPVWTLWMGQNIPPLPEIELQFLFRPTPILVTVLTELYPVLFKARMCSAQTESPLIYHSTKGLLFLKSRATICRFQISDILMT